MGACWQWVLEPVRLQILKQLFGSERVNRSAVLGMARVDIESPAAASGMDHVCRNIEGMDHVCSIASATCRVTRPYPSRQRWRVTLYGTRRAGLEKSVSSPRRSLSASTAPTYRRRAGAFGQW